MIQELWWQAIKDRHVDLSLRAGNPNLSPEERRTVQKELAFLDSIITIHTEIEAIQRECTQLEKDAQGSLDPDMKELFVLEAADCKDRIEAKSKELEDRMAPPDQHDDRDVYLEIRAGAGGQEASLFVADLMRMYTNYALKHNWRVSIENESMTDLGGYREVVLHIKGKDVYGKLKFESGVHRVQRVPATETQGRVHTSTVTVAVMPEAQDVDVHINPADLRIDVYRSGGAGGQHVNTTDSAVRITHIPTGVVVACQDERSQHKNKAKAMKMLQSRILAAQMEKHHEEMSKMRKEQVGTGMRAEKVRTYNFPQNRVTDHQVDLTLKNLDVVMTGELDPIIDALVAKDREQRKQAFLHQILKK
ncbi:MAG TPA: peptide chain release factor 1 [Candidatus Babeliales bacterium]|jgi:peptide chain release factor 1|nr:peptide chain release factor 1 [Candidatus Babeliales bacterium]